MRAPPDFGTEHREQWNRWVLGHGLPPLPGDDVAPGDSVPVAYWIGSRTAAVLHVRWNDDDGQEPFTETDVELFCRTGDAWEAVGGGGGNWADERPALTRPDVPADHVALFGANGSWIGDSGCTAWTGEVGTAAATVEVVQDGEMVRRPLDSHAGALVVCGGYDRPMTIRVLDAADRVLAEFTEPAFDV